MTHLWRPEKEGLLLANSEAPTFRLTHDPSEGPEAWSNPCGNLGFVGPNPIRTLVANSREGLSARVTAMSEPRGRGDRLITVATADSSASAAPMPAPRGRYAGYPRVG